MDWDTLAAFQFEMIKLKYDLGVLSAFACFYAEYMTYELRPFGNVGPISGLGRGLGLDYDAVAVLGGL